MKLKAVSVLAPTKLVVSTSKVVVVGTENMNVSLVAPAAKAAAMTAGGAANALVNVTV
jgi:hypothetical protein